MDNSIREQMKEAIEFYQRQKFSIIPIVAGKKNPLIDWKEYTQRLPNAGELAQWWLDFWSQGAGIAIVCGKVSGIFAIDVDSKEGEAWIASLNLPRTALSNTPHGSHYIFKHPGYTIPNAVSLSPGVDVRADGGYIVAPPSHNGNGQKYHWIVSLDIRANCPKEVLELIQQKENKVQSGDKPNWISKALQQGVDEGKRNDTCFKLAGYFKNTHPIEITQQILLSWNEKNRPPLSQGDVLTAINSAYSYAASNTNIGGGEGIYKRTRIASDFVSKASKKGQENGNKLSKKPSDNSIIPHRQGIVNKSSIWGDVRAYLQDNLGKVMSYDQVDREFEIRSVGDKHTRRQLIYQLVVDGQAEKLGSGKFRLYEEGFQPFDPERIEDTEPLNITLPLGLEKHTQLHKGNVVIYCGDPDSGKTLLAIETVKLNLGKMKWRYWWSETGAGELHSRVKEYLGLPHPNFRLYERDGDFADCIRRFPDDAHIVDFLGRPEAEWNFIGSDIRRMVEAQAGRGFLVICLQLNSATGYAFGGQETEHLPRLFLVSILNKQSGISTVTIRKLKKPPKGEPNIRGQECKFKPMQDGCGVNLISDWK